MLQTAVVERAWAGPQFVLVVHLAGGMCGDVGLAGVVEVSVLRRCR